MSDLNKEAYSQSVNDSLITFVKNKIPTTITSTLVLKPELISVRSKVSNNIAIHSLTTDITPTTLRAHKDDPLSLIQSITDRQIKQLFAKYNV